MMDRLLPHQMDPDDLHEWAERNAGPPGRTDPVGRTESSPTPGPVVSTLSDVAVEAVEWLWPGYLPAGKLVVVDGDPAAGKSTLMLDLAARCSTGTAWPDGTPNGVPRGVLLLSAEDGLGDTIAPRLEAARADRHLVHALTDIREVDDDGLARLVPPSLPRDLPIIETTIRRTSASLVVIDVLMAYLSGKVDSHRDQDVRGVLHSLAAVAERTGATIVLIRHLNKGGGGNALYRGGGSIGIIGAARAAFLVARDPEDTDRRVLAVTKMNVAPEPPALAYRIATDAGLGCAVIRWDEEPVSDVTAASLLRGPLDADELSERDEHESWLRDYLTENGGEALAANVRNAATSAGFPWPAIQKVRAKVAETQRQGFGPGAYYVWRLRSGGQHGSLMDHMDSHPHEPESMESMRNPWTSSEKGSGRQPRTSQCGRCHSRDVELVGQDTRGRDACTDCAAAPGEPIAVRPPEEEAP